MRDDHYAATARKFHHITHFAVRISRCTLRVAHFALHTSRCTSRCTFRVAHFALHISRCTFRVAHAACVDVRRAGSHGPHGRGALRLVWRPIPARLPTGMPEIESLEHKHQLTRIHFHVLLSRPRRHRDSERPRLETFVQNQKSCAVPCQNLDPVSGEHDILHTDSATPSSRIASIRYTASGCLSSAAPVTAMAPWFTSTWTHRSLGSCPRGCLMR